jgi:hypothetical protein
MSRSLLCSPLRAAPGALASLAAAAAALAALAACGDNLAGPRADAALPPDAPPGGPRAVIAAGTFMPGEAGLLSMLTFDPLKVAPRVDPTGAIGSDPVIRRVGGELLVVNRADGNNVTILDDRTFIAKAQIGTGPGSNPQDVAVYADKLFVPAFGTAGVVVLSRTSIGDRTIIDLSALDPDGEPNCVSAFTVGDEIYVACEVLDPSYKPRGPGQIAVIDAASNAVKTTFSLAAANPFGAFEQLPAGVLGGDLVIPTVPSFGDFSEGCLERVQPGAAPRANGCVVANRDLGAYPARTDVQLRGDTPILWLIASSFDTAPHGRLMAVDLAAGTLSPTPISPDAQILVDLAVCPNGLIVVADQTTSANGLRVYDGPTEQTTAPLPIGLRPGSSHGLACY